MASLRDLCHSLNDIYREKNKEEVILTHVFGATFFISGAIKMLGDDVAKRGFANKEKILTVLLKRVLTATEIWGFDFFLKHLSAKYPPYGCAYCNAKPCKCGQEKVRPAELAVSDQAHSVDAWGLADWQAHLHTVYGEANHRRFSLHDMVILTMTEYHEVMIALEHSSLVSGTTTLDDDIRKIAIEETTDLFARILSLANYVNVPLEETITARYGSGCPLCGHRLCQCPPRWSDYKDYERLLLSQPQKSK